MKLSTIAAVVVTLALAVVVVPAVLSRAAFESRNAVVELSLDFTSVNALSLRTGIPVRAILAAARRRGVTSVVLAEDTRAQSTPPAAVLLRRYGTDGAPGGTRAFLPEGWNDTVPVGFSPAKIAEVTAAGLDIVFRPQNAGDMTWLSESPAIKGRKIILDSRDVPGYPDPLLLCRILPENPLIVMEFAAVTGLSAVKRSFPRRIVQGHTITIPEQNKGFDEGAWLSRWTRAVRERGNRFLLVSVREQESLEKNMGHVEQLRAALEREGFTAGTAVPPLYPYRDHVNARVAVALAAAIGFPLLALWAAKVPAPPLGKYAVVNAVTLCGGLTVASLLFDGALMQRAVDIPLIKVAMFLPLLLSLLILFPRHRLREFWRYPVEMRQLVLFGLLAALLTLMLARSGNTVGEWARPETGLRQWLEDVLFIRPRSKEFLFGQPLLYLGFALGNPWLVWLGMVGQVSVINTFLHAHTPVVVSLVRTAYGIIFGLAAGWVIDRGMRRMGVRR